MSTSVDKLVVGATATDVANWLTKNVSEKRGKRAIEKFVAEKVPLKGYFSHTGLKTSKIGEANVTYPVVVITVSESDKTEIGQVSFSAIYRSIFADSIAQIRKEGKYKDKWMNVSRLMHDWQKEMSESDAIAYCLGKTYVAEYAMRTIAEMNYVKETDTVTTIVDASSKLLAEDKLKAFRASKEIPYFTVG